MPILLYMAHLAFQQIAYPVAVSRTKIATFISELFHLQSTQLQNKITFE